jgi:hypothetical protein
MRAVLWLTGLLIVGRLMNLAPEEWRGIWDAFWECAGTIVDRLGSHGGHWINRHGFYLPTFPEYEFIPWLDAALYVTLGSLIRVLLWYRRRIKGLTADLFRANLLAGQASRTAKLAAAAQYTPPPVTPEFRHERARPPSGKEARIVELIEGAIGDEQVVLFDYVDREGEFTSREVEPMRVYFSGRDHYMEGHCLLREDTRTFRVSRMQNVQVDGRVESVQ